jgi:LmbE family N-acetylglucosaminyl deacetylase
MRADAFLAAARALPKGDLRAITGGTALVLAPHPDDESLGCGGLIAASCAAGAPPLVVILTDGAASHPNSRAYPPKRLRETREAETLSAIACLGLTADRVVFLRTHDTQAPSDGVELTELASRIAGLVRVYDCRSILATWASDPHCDHLAAHRIAQAAAAATQIVHRGYPVWGLTLQPDTMVEGPPTGMRLDIGAYLPAKRRAIACHVSQYGGLIDDDPDGFQMDPDFMALFDTPTEIYLDVPS